MHKFSKSAPQNPGVKLAILSLILLYSLLRIFNFFKCISSIEARAYFSGKVNSIFLSNLPALTKASSKEDDKLVAPKTTTLVSVLKPQP